MKKIILSLCFISIIAGQAFAGHGGSALEKGNSAVDVYYGFPNLFAAILKAAYTNSGYATGVSIKSFGPIGLRYEYMVSDKIGVGAEVNHLNTSVEFSETYEEYNSSTGNYDTYNYSYKITVPRTRIMGRFNIHFGSSEKFDGYFGIGAGYSASKVTVETNEPGYSDQASINLIPVAFRVAVGGRYYFTNNIGIGAELGLGGGPIIGGGLALKF